MYDNILIPTDGSTEGEKGERHGVALADSVDATVHALYVVEEGGNPWRTESMDDQVERAREYGQGVLDDVATACAERDVECVTHIEVGPRVHEEINECVEDEEVDLIVMGSGYRGRLGGLLGSTAEKVLRSAEVPVTTLRRGERE
jgi:nucleotide-binding universal stress UspA family protein